MIQKMRKFVCFVSETGRADRPLHDPSVRYRCFHPAEILKNKGHYCSVISASRFYENPNLDYDVYVFHRPNKARAGFEEIVRFLRKQGSLVIADYDDLIFGPPDIALESSAVKNETLTPEKAVAAFSSNLAGLLEFDRVTVQVVLQALEPLRLCPLKTEPGVAEVPFCHSIACASSASAARVDRSVISAYTAAGSAAIDTVAFTGAVMRRS